VLLDQHADPAFRGLAKAALAWVVQQRLELLTDGPREAVSLKMPH
jgi:hypothetical protein